MDELWIVFAESGRCGPLTLCKKMARPALRRCNRNEVFCCFRGQTVSRSPVPGVFQPAALPCQLPYNAALAGIESDQAQSCPGASGGVPTIQGKI